MLQGFPFSVNANVIWHLFLLIHQSQCAALEDLMTSASDIIVQISCLMLKANNNQYCWWCMQSKYILIATGGTPAVPPLEGKELCVISDAVLDTMERPQK